MKAMQRVSSAAKRKLGDLAANRDGAIKFSCDDPHGNANSHPTDWESSECRLEPVEPFTANHRGPSATPLHPPRSLS
jgi:hypothetical protein